MTSYLFYPRLPDGTALMFEAYECADDADAGDHALAVLAEHHSAVEVAIWRGERLVACVRAEAAPKRQDSAALGSVGGAAAG